MAGLSITGQLKVSSLKKKFLDEFGLNIRVYSGRSEADPDVTLANARKHKGTGKALSVAKNMKVGNLEDKFLKEFGLKVQISGSDDSYLCNNDLTLNAAQQADVVRLARKSKRESAQIKAQEASNSTEAVSKSIQKEFGNLGFGETAKVTLNFSRSKSEDINEVSSSNDIGNEEKTYVDSEINDKDISASLNEGESGLEITEESLDDLIQSVSSEDNSSALEEVDFTFFDLNSGAELKSNETNESINSSPESEIGTSISEVDLLGLDQEKHIGGDSINNEALKFEQFELEN
jgi:hypothetical protein